MREDPDFVVGATRLGRMFERSRWWGGRVLADWWEEQRRGGPVRVFRRASGRLYTTVAIVDQHMPRRRNDVLDRRLRAFERDLSEAFARIAELERRMGRRR